MLVKAINNIGCDSSTSYATKSELNTIYGVVGILWNIIRIISINDKSH